MIAKINYLNYKMSIIKLKIKEMILMAQTFLYDSYIPNKETIIIKIQDKIKIYRIQTIYRNYRTTFFHKIQQQMERYLIS